MAIQSTAFGPVILSDVDAEQFREQIVRGPDERARALIDRRQRRTVRCNEAGERVLADRRTPAQTEHAIGG